MTIMPKLPEPVVLELATLTREQMGPYLLLGLDKSADKEQIDKHWADRVKWALRQPSQVKASREDVNWAHDLLKEIDKRIRCDVSSLNTDTADGVIGQLTSRYGVNGGQPGRAWQPLDNEKPLADYMPPAELPDAAEVRAALIVPETPEEMPFAATLLERLAQQDLDPWAVELPPQDSTP
jgi:hypothetical protein